MKDYGKFQVRMRRDGLSRTHLRLGNVISGKRSICSKSSQVQGHDDCRRSISCCNFHLYGCALTIGYDNVVRRIDIDGLIKRHCNVRVIDSRVGGRIMSFDGSVRQTSNELLDVSYSLSRSDRRSESVGVPECEIVGVLKASPFCQGKQITKRGVPERHSLCKVDVIRLSRLQGTFVTS